MTSQITETRRREIFKPLERQIHLCGFTDADIFRMLADLTTESPQLASAICTHLSLLHDQLTEDQEWSHSEFIAKAYYAVFFDPSTAFKYGTNFICEDEGAMQDFVTEHVTMLQVDAQYGVASVMMGDFSGRPN